MTDSGVFLPVSLRVLWFHIVILYLFLPVFLWVMFQIVTDSVRVLTCISVGPVSDCVRLWCVLTCISVGPVSNCDSVRVLTCISVGHVSGRDSLRSAANNPHSHGHRK